MKKSLLLTAAMLLTAALMAGCTTKQVSATLMDGANAETAAAAAVDTADMFTKRDLETGYDASDSAAITLRDGGSSSESPYVSVSGDKVTITGEGVYVLAGTLTNGQVIVDCPADAKVQLVLDGASVTCDGSAALYVRQADKVFLTTAAGMANTLSQTGAFKAIDGRNIDAAVFSLCDLTLSGAGKLTVNAATGHGIVSKDDLTAASGTYDITSALCALSGSNSVRVANGVYALDAGSDGIRADNGDKTEQGFLYIADGSFDIRTGTDGLDAQEGLRVDGGTFLISAANDALNAGGGITVNGGSFILQAGDDGMHSDTDVLVTAGILDIRKSYEGIEGKNITLSGGDISIVSSDDGLNAVSGSTAGNSRQYFFSSDPDCSITLSGGSLTVNASGDGLDSNGALTISGGNIRVSGPTASNNGSIDAGTATATGGTLIAAGSAGMAAGFDGGSTQGSILYTLASVQQAGTQVTLLDGSGAAIAQLTPAKVFQSINITAPGILMGSTYTLMVGSQEYAITMDALTWSNGGGGGFGFGMGSPPGRAGAAEPADSKTSSTGNPGATVPDGWSAMPFGSIMDGADILYGRVTAVIGSQLTLALGSFVPPSEPGALPASGKSQVSDAAAPPDSPLVTGTHDGTGSGRRDGIRAGGAFALTGETMNVTVGAEVEITRLGAGAGQGRGRTRSVTAATLADITAGSVVMLSYEAGTDTLLSIRILDGYAAAPL